MQFHQKKSKSNVVPASRWVSFQAKIKSMLCALLSAILLPDDSTHQIYYWGLFDKERIVLEMAEKPGTEQFELEEDYKDFFTVELQDYTNPEIKIEKNQIIAIPKSPVRYASSKIVLGFPDNHRSEDEETMLAYGYCKIVKGFAEAGQTLGMDAEVIVSWNSEQELLAKLVWKKKPFEGGYITTFGRDEELKKDTEDEYQTTKDGFVNLGKIKKWPLLVAGTVYEKKNGSKYGYDFEGIQHRTTIIVPKP